MLSPPDLNDELQTEFNLCDTAQYSTFYFCTLTSINAAEIGQDDQNLKKYKITL